MAKKRNIKSKSKRGKWVFLAAAAAVAVLAAALIIGALYSGGAGDNSLNESLVIDEGGSLVIPINEISEAVSFYPVTIDGVNMEVIAVEAQDGTLRTALNTCQVCVGSPLAYFVQLSGSLECQACGNMFQIDRVGVEAGGCNPVPLSEGERTVTDQSVEVSFETMRAYAFMFPANWKTE